MNEELLDKMRCPYCNGDFRVASRLRHDAGHLQYGLLECRCFRFPVVDGVLLLSMAKSYGGGEEDLQPYAPMLVAATTFLEAGDVDGLLAWLARHAPLVAQLVAHDDETYLEWAARLHAATEDASRRYLAAQHRFEVVGTGPEGRRQRLGAALRRSAPGAPDAADPLIDQLYDFYVSRFVGPRVNSLALTLASLRPPESLLSLCCGHGIMENLIRAAGGDTTVVSVDAQLVNLLLTRRFANPDGTFICHDVQFPLPFREGAFEAVTSSTCLPEIPAQASFAREAIRVTSPAGWCLFDSVWNTELGVKRVDSTRHYRYCQNFFADLEEYVTFFDECAGEDREVGLDVPGAPIVYASESQWAFGEARQALLVDRVEPLLSFLVVGRGSRPVVAPSLPWLRVEQLSVSPVFDAVSEGQQIHLRRRAPFEDLLSHFAPASFEGYPSETVIDLTSIDRQSLLAHFARGELTLLPMRFGDDYPVLSSVARI